MRSELVIRFDYGDVVPWVRHIDDARHRDRRPGRALLPHARADARREHADDLRVHVEEGERVPFVLTWYPSHEEPPAAHRPRGRARRDGELLARVERTLEARSAGRVARRPAALAHGPEGADVRTDRRHRRGADDVAPGADRRRAQLGLPLLLAARRDADAARAAPRRLRRRGARVATLAAARGRGRSGRPPDHVRRRRRAPPHRVRAAVAPGLRRLRAGARRQRRERAAPGRRLRRGDGRALPGARARAREGGAGVAAPARAPRPPRAHLARARTRGSGRSAASAGTSCTRR